MNIFLSIDQKLSEFANKHNAKIYYSETNFDITAIDERQIRKIIWTDGTLLKAIFMLPAATVHHNSPSNLWDFIIHASVNEETPGELPFWTKDLLEAVPFQEIERQIDELLTISENTLAKVGLEDMKLTWGYIKWPDGRTDLID